MADKPTFFQKFLWVELGTKILPYIKNSAELTGELSSNVIVNNVNVLLLPSAEPLSRIFAKQVLDKKGRKKENVSNVGSGIIPSLISLFGNYSLGEWISGLGILPVINMIQITATTLLETGFRFLSSSLMLPINNLNKSKAGTVGKIVGNILLSPLFMLSQILALTADVCSYTRQFLDSAIHFFNPLWWVCKRLDAIGIETNTPSIKIVAKTLLSSTLRLLPAAALITLGVLSAGATIPFIGASSTLSTFGSFVASTFTATSAITVALGTAAAVYAGGAIATVSKFLSYCVKTVIPPKAFSEARSGITSPTKSEAASKKTPSGNTNNKVDDRLKAARAREKKIKESVNEVTRVLEEDDPKITNEAATKAVPIPATNTGRGVSEPKPPFRPRSI